MGRLGLGEEHAGHHRRDNEGDDQGRIAPLGSVPAERELGHLIGGDEECTVLRKVDRVQIDTGSDGLHEGEHRDGLGDAQAHHDGQHE